MKKYVLVFLLLYIVTISAQDNKENQGQSIELPDFVITGVQSIDIPIQKKPRPDLVPTLSKDFFTPAYTPEEFELSDFSKPIRKDVEKLGGENYYSGMFFVGAGINTLPTGEFYFNAGGENVLFSANLWGTNIKDYEDYSDYNVSGISLNTDFFVSSKSDFLPGLNIGLNAEYVRDAYKFYGSIFPSAERERQNGNVELSFINTLNNSINYGLEFSGAVFNLNDINLRENNLSGKGFLELYMGKLGIGGQALIHVQSLKDYFPDMNNEYLSASGYLQIKSTNSLHAKIGVTYSKNDTSSFFAPVASVDARLGNNLSFHAEYSPEAEFYTISDLTSLNMYYNIGSVPNVFVEKKSNFQGMFKYQYGKYFEIIIGGGYSKTDNFIFFEDVFLPGTFELQTADDVEKTYGFADLFFHLGPFGQFYSNSEYQIVKNSVGNYLPYNPKFKSDLIYQFNVAENLYIQTGVQFAFYYFSDSKNLNKVNNFNNLFASAGYTISGGLLVKVMVQNILNNENYKLSRYKEKPFDVLAGIEYRW